MPTVRAERGPILNSAYLLTFKIQTKATISVFNQLRINKLKDLPLILKTNQLAI